MTEQLQLFAWPRCRCGDVHCVDCEINTVKIREYYMVHDVVWPLDKNGGTLCIGCLERRIGRQLVPADFKDVPLNRLGGHSTRLGSRMRGTP